MQAAELLLLAEDAVVVVVDVVAVADEKSEGHLLLQICCSLSVFVPLQALLEEMPPARTTYKQTNIANSIC